MGVIYRLIDTTVSEDFLGFLDYYPYLTSIFISKNTFPSLFISMTMFNGDAGQMCHKYISEGVPNAEKICLIRTELQAYTEIFGAYPRGIDEIKKEMCKYIKMYKGI